MRDSGEFTYLWSSWTPFAGWFWHPAGARPPLTSSTAESLVLLTADPPWVSSTLTNPPNSQCPILPHSSLSHCRSLVEKISFKSMVRRLVFLNKWRSSIDNYGLSLVAHSVWVSLNNTWKDDWIIGWAILSRVASDQIWHLLECTWVLSVKVKYHMVHCCSFLRVHLLLRSNSPQGRLQHWLNEILFFRVGQEWILFFGRVLQMQPDSPSQSLAPSTARQGDRDDSWR